MKLSRVSKSRTRGFSMIEVLVAVLVLSVGLLGMAALMATSMRNAHSANQRTQATNLAYDIIDSMRTNLPNAMRYHLPAYSNAAALCPVGTNRTARAYPVATQPHAHDMNRWLQEVCYTLPNGQARVVVTRTSVPMGTGRNWNTYQAVVDICWFDDRAAGGAADCSNATPGPDTVITVGSAL